MQWEDTMSLVKIRIFETFLVEAILILEMTKANHIHTTKVLIKELTTTLLINLLQCGA